MAADVMNAIHTIYSDDDFNRLTYCNTAGHAKALVDIHGMSVCAAMRFINNLINLVCTMTQSSFQMTVIHGFNHGTSLQNMVRHDLDNVHIKERIADDRNPGITRLVIS